MNLIVAVDKNWAIGKNNKLMWSIPADMKYFRETTKGNIVIMGRKTLESFPQGQPLKNRTNIVITKNPDYKVKDALIVHSIEEAMEEAKKYEGEIYVIGGESIYRAMLPYCEKALVTKIDHAYDADTYFPNLDEDPEWTMTKISEEQTCFNIILRFTKGTQGSNEDIEYYRTEAKQYRKRDLSDGACKGICKVKVYAGGNCRRHTGRSGGASGRNSMVSGSV